MNTAALITHIEITDDYGEPVAHVAGTRITVGEIAAMHLQQESSVDWIVENFEVLNHAQVYAALSYYFDHREDIDAQLQRAAAAAKDHADITHDALLAKLRARLRSQDSGPLT